jgi:hypothetical protein
MLKKTLACLLCIGAVGAVGTDGTAHDSDGNLIETWSGE